MKRKLNTICPPVNSPEFEPWLIARVKAIYERILPDNYQPNEFDTGALLVGNINDIIKSHAEFFLDKSEEYTAEERRRLFNLHKNDNT